MRRYIKQAREQGLNWQSLVIEDAETEIKVIVKDAVLSREAWILTNAKITKVVNEAVNELESPELKVRSKRVLYEYATVQYRRLKLEYADLNIYLIAAVVALQGKTRITEQTVKEIKKNAQRANNTEFERLVNGLSEKYGYYEISQPLQMFSRRYQERVDSAFKELAGSTAKDSYSSNVSLRNVAEMTVRYEKTVASVEELKNQGVKLVWISAHANCSERCEKAQGKLYSLDGSSGWIEGIKYEPLENVTEVYYTTKEGKRYRNGILYGFNCRHYLIPYKKGERPITVPEATVRKQRAINQRQREYERDIRFNRSAAAIYKNVDKTAYNYYSNQAITTERQYIEYSKENEVAYYPSRMAILDEDVQLLAEKYGKALDESHKKAYNEIKEIEEIKDFTAKGRRNHETKHLAEFGVKSFEQYQAKAQEFFKIPVDGKRYFGYTRSNGDNVRYDVYTNTYGVVAKDGIIRTMYKPKEGIKYYLGEVKKDVRR